MKTIIREKSWNGAYRELPAEIKGAGRSKSGERFVVLNVDYTDWLKAAYPELSMGSGVQREVLREIAGTGFQFVHKCPQKIQSFLTDNPVGTQAKVSGRQFEVISFEEETIDVNRTLMETWVHY